jgi:hypothetical protein
MTMAEHKVCDERVRKAWDAGFRFGWWVGLVCGAIVFSVGFAVAAAKILL